MNMTDLKLHFLMDNCLFLRFSTALVKPLWFNFQQIFWKKKLLITVIVVKSSTSEIQQNNIKWFWFRTFKNTHIIKQDILLAHWEVDFFYFFFILYSNSFNSSATGECDESNVDEMHVWWAKLFPLYLIWLFWNHDNNLYITRHIKCVFTVLFL